MKPGSLEAGLWESHRLTGDSVELLIFNVTLSSFSGVLLLPRGGVNFGKIFLRFHSSIYVSNLVSIE